MYDFALFESQKFAFRRYLIYRYYIDEMNKNPTMNSNLYRRVTKRPSRWWRNF